MLILDQLHLSEIGFGAKLEIQGPLNLLYGGSNTLQDPHTRGNTQTERNNISTNANKDMTD